MRPSRSTQYAFWGGVLGIAAGTALLVGFYSDTDTGGRSLSDKARIVLTPGLIGAAIGALIGASHDRLLSEPPQFSAPGTP
jgi:hypothetical protein